ncbi:hypothetical protein [Aminicella lysinilytica]|jgi:hypothetical protein|uniref:hypothetical protein n=1 Tax=Aminicella lysinilytica TaxID=433323 RepID=UPI00180CBA69|nr:hypothetical protein [Aminicella lysinilytica]NLD11681.1 hypothetical protein [Clostridiales bacterium]
MEYVLNETQYRTLMASIYMDLEYDNYKKSRVFKLMFGKKYNQFSKRVERYPRVVISMERLQMSGRNDDITVIFDTNFKYWSEGTGAADMTRGRFNGGSAVRSLSGEYIMGVRTEGDVPHWLTQGLEDAGIFRKI